MPRERRSASNVGYTYWVLKCPYCEGRKVIYWPGQALPELLTCHSCDEGSASLSWGVAFMAFYSDGLKDSWLRLVRGGHVRYSKDGNDRVAYPEPAFEPPNAHWPPEE